MTNRVNSDGTGRVLVLASQSAQRLALLRQIGFEPVCMPADVDESAKEGESPDELVLRLSALKARSCASRAEFSGKTREYENAVVVAADTVIDLDGTILGKPRDEADAISMLQSLSDREHRVHTGVSVYDTGSNSTFEALVSTTVRFSDIPQSTARRYWQSGEPHGKAGSYAIQGAGAQFVVHLSGSYSNVVGLPLFESAKLLERAGLTTF